MHVRMILGTEYEAGPGPINNLGREKKKADFWPYLPFRIYAQKSVFSFIESRAACPRTVIASPANGTKQSRWLWSKHREERVSWCEIDRTSDRPEASGPYASK